MDNNSSSLHTITVPQLYAIVDFISEVPDRSEAIRMLSSLSDSIKLHGIRATASALSINSIAGYVDGAIGLLVKGNSIDTIVGDLKVKLSSAINERSELPDIPYALSRQPSRVEGKAVNVAFYNPTFDPGSDTATCIELDGKVAGLAFSTDGIQNILRSAGVYLNNDDIQQLTAEAGVFISEDNDDTYTPQEYANGLYKEFSDKLSERIVKGSTITYGQMIEGYKKMAEKNTTAAENYYDNLTTSQLRTLLLDTWVSSNRPAKFNKDKINFFTREELIEAIEDQEVQPVETKKSYTIADIFKIAEDQLMNEDYSIGNDNPIPFMSRDEIKRELINNHVIQDPDSDVLIELNGDIINVASPTDNINEVFGGEELDDAIDFYQELLSRNNLTHTAGEVKDPSVPAKQDVEWAKGYITTYLEKQKAYNEAIAIATAEVRKKLNMADLSPAEYARAEEIILRKVAAVKTGTLKIAEDLYATMKMSLSGGSDSIKEFGELVAEAFNIEKSLIDQIKQKAKTPVWEKHQLILNKNKKEMPGGAYFKKDVKKTEASLNDFNAVMSWADDLIGSMNKYYEVEEQILNFFKTTRKSTEDFLAMGV